MAHRLKTKMPVSERAKQFMPFAALKDLPAALAQRERITVPRAELSEDAAEELDRILHQLQPGSLITIVYYDQEDYIRFTGMVAAFHETSRILQVVDRKIPLDDIFSITLET